jgi:hypothetical protein
LGEEAEGQVAVDLLEWPACEDATPSLWNWDQKPLKVLGWGFVSGLIFGEKGLQPELELDVEVNVDFEVEVEV